MSPLAPIILQCLIQRNCLPRRVARAATILPQCSAPLEMSWAIFLCLNRDIGLTDCRYVYIILTMSDDMNLPANFAKLCACLNIRKAARAVTSLYDAVLLRPTGLRSTQATLLMAIATAGTPTISRLADYLVMDRTTLARDLKPLEDQGLVRITPGSDRRTRQIQLTDAGSEKVRQIIPLWEQAQAKIIAVGLGYERWGKLYDELQEIVRLAQA